MIFQNTISDKPGKKEVTDSDIRSVFFGDYMSPKCMDSPGEKLYNEVSDTTGEQKFGDNHHFYSFMNMIPKLPFHFIHFNFQLQSYGLHDKKM